MANCRYCGSPLEGNEKFCPSCGAKNDGTGGAYTQNTQNTAPPPTPQVVTADGYDRSDVDKTKVLCALAYLGILFFLPLVAYPNSRFGKFHANQALVLLIAETILSTVVSVFTNVWYAFPFMPDIIKGLVGAGIGFATGALSLAAAIYGIVTAASGKAKEIPIIGKFNLINRG